MFVFAVPQIKEFNENLEKDRGSLKNGPVGNRSITDCICCIVFLVAIVGFFAASWYGYKNGDPMKLFIGWDSDGKGCGYTAGYEDYPYLYWPEPPSNDNVDLVEAIKTLNFGAALELLNYGVCVKECPSADQAKLIECKATDYITGNANYVGCVYQIGVDFLDTWGVDPYEYTG